MIPIFMSQERKYTGAELKPQVIARATGKALDDDAILAFIGPARVKTDALVDMDDRIAGREITSQEMVHFLVELFGYGIWPTVLFQYWLVELVVARIHYLGGNEDAWVESQGNDIMVEFSDQPAGKLSVSIATVSPIGGLIHLGLNGSNDGTPDDVDTACLRQLGIEPKALAVDVIHQVAERHKNMMAAACKVLPR